MILLKTTTNLGEPNRQVDMPSTGYQASQVLTLDQSVPMLCLSTGPGEPSLHPASLGHARTAPRARLGRA
ncbi:hypothetical protein PanWU01x14_023260 [Parasponia andersonii]|uniref:Uncharacterized protein n=1 Tax=Parasponia andersonii TaxID=3476 RepID=A0A2P5DXF7_PARAD|nr:hypothetical protein PanWU01x14_023260 [Parasponia andersonii]